MAQKIQAQFVCDICGKDGTRYVLTSPKRKKALDRCDRHDRDIQKLLDGPGEVLNQHRPRAGVQISTPDEIASKRK